MIPKSMLSYDRKDVKTYQMIKHDAQVRDMVALKIRPPVVRCGISSQVRPFSAGFPASTPAATEGPLRGSNSGSASRSPALPARSATAGSAPGAAPRRPRDGSALLPPGPGSRGRSHQGIPPALPSPRCNFQTGSIIETVISFVNKMVGPFVPTNRVDRRQFCARVVGGHYAPPYRRAWKRLRPQT